MYSVMLVDDELPALEQMKELLKTCEGISSISMYDNPREALDAAAEQRPDFMFLDIQMPEVSGLYFAERLHPLSPDTEIIFVTAYRDYAFEAFELSAADYLLKPVDPGRLHKTWNKLVLMRNSTPKSDKKDEIAAHFSLLGTYELTGPEGALKWRTHKAEELFAYLWIHRQGGVSVILNEVFPQWNFEKGKQYLHTTVYQIRKMLRSAGLGDYIELTFDRENYKLQSQSILSDIEMFQETASRALEERSIEDLRQSVSLYKGDLLSSMDSLWVYNTRDKYRRIYLKLLEQLTKELIGIERHYEAEEYAIRLMELEPLEESYAIQLITLYHTIGKPLRAQRAFTQFREAYIAEMEEELPDWFLDAYQNLVKS